MTASTDKDTSVNARSPEKRIDHLMNAFIYERDLQWLRDARISLGLPPTLAAYKPGSRS